MTCENVTSAAAGELQEGMLSRHTCIMVVGTAQTLKLYGRMKRLAIPSPMTRRIQSSKFRGLPWASAFCFFASIRPVSARICKASAMALYRRDTDHGYRSISGKFEGARLTWSSFGRDDILFWKGYATHLSRIQTYDIR